ncbi:cilia- and flagella-associated protein 36 [Topomyia yanbarensis]|uniref:cilia- and flagella-associated protein 36 n=1 Tax=Topomyia yanbarensis TaxID=2498891 RepID=UPI00273BD8C7|nr:cilia- and flagella-associated protein 36 [Topomyia yanbarensis]
MTEDNSWVFDSLVCFLHGPVWNAPLQTFIEDKSIIFDPNVSSDQDNPEFRKVHDEYKNLVDYMLGSFMEEMQITPEQFEFACLEGRNTAAMEQSTATAGTGEGRPGGGHTFSFHQGLFQQIWAANDIRIFIRMMTQRNVEIQLQALDLIERRQASMGAASIEKDEDKVEPQPDDQSTGEVIQGGNDGEQADMTGDLAAEVEMEQAIMKSVDEEIKTEPLFVPPQHEPPNNESEDVSDKFKRLNLFFVQDTVNNDDMRTRQEYLRSQRDKILQLKKQARARQLNETIKKSERPASAQVAQKILENGTADGTAPPDHTGTSLQLRKMLAQRLRSEIVEQ